MSAEAIAKGTSLAPDEAVVWRGSPSGWTIARDVYHLRELAAYLAFLVGLDAYQAWSKALPVAKALHDSVPIAVIIVSLLVNFAGLAWLTARSTRYTITAHRTILAYGVALPATLSIPHSQIEKIELSLKTRHQGDIAFSLKDGNRMPYLKLWPYARPWRLARPQPMLRGVARATVVASLATRAVELDVHGRRSKPAPRETMAA